MSDYVVNINTAIQKSRRKFTPPNGTEIAK